MAQTIYGLLADYGDGSAGIRWFRNLVTVDAKLSGNSTRDLDDDEDYEDDGDNCYWMNEGSPGEVLTFPDDLDLEACGFVFSD
jgi:hypothetical protein